MSANQIERAEGLRVAVQVTVAPILPNCPRCSILRRSMRFLRLGAIVVEHNLLYTGAEPRYMFEDHGAKVAIVGQDCPHVTDADDPPHIYYSVNLISAMPRLMRTALKPPVKSALPRG